MEREGDAMRGKWDGRVRGERGIEWERMRREGDGMGGEKRRGDGMEVDERSGEWYVRGIRGEWNGMREVRGEGMG